MPTSRCHQTTVSSHAGMGVIEAAQPLLFLVELVEEWGGWRRRRGGGGVGGDGDSAGMVTSHAHTLQ